jgi:hypothetical protein
VIVARVPALLALMRQAAPRLSAAFAPVRAAVGSQGEREAARIVYRDLAASDFSADVLGARPSNLAVLPVEGVEWCDWGDPGRVVSTLAALGVRPAWVDRLTMTA